MNHYNHHQTSLSLWIQIIKISFVWHFLKKKTSKIYVHLENEKSLTIINLINKIKREALILLTWWWWWSWWWNCIDDEGCSVVLKSGTIWIIVWFWLCVLFYFSINHSPSCFSYFIFVLGNDIFLQTQNVLKTDKTFLYKDRNSLMITIM